jgi:hypothetical protein
MVAPKAGKGGSMVMIVGSVIVLGFVFIYFMNPVLFGNIVATVARWFRF